MGLGELRQGSRLILVTLHNCEPFQWAPELGALSGEDERTWQRRGSAESSR